MIWLIFAPKRANLEVFVKYSCWMIDKKWILLAVFILENSTTEKFFHSNILVTFSTKR